MTEEPEITTLGQKGQVVIPQTLRKHLGVGPKTKFLVFGEGDVIILKRLRLPDVQGQWMEVLSRVGEKKLGLTEAQVAAEVRAARRTRARKPKG